MSRWLFILRRLARALIVLFLVVSAGFVLVRAAPGDPALIIAGEQGASDEAFLADIRSDYGLDRPAIEQYVIYISAIGKLDFGHSYREHRPVIDMIAERLPATILLSVSALVLALMTGIPLGVLAARREGSLVDTLLTSLSVAFFAMPIFWVGLLLILIFSVWLMWLPAYGMFTVGASLSGVGVVLDIARHLVLPAMTLGLFYMAVYMRVTRASVLEVSNRDFVRTARAKGLNEFTVWRRHIVRNALLPVITVASVQAGHLIGGSVLIETVFAWPGVGRLAFDALMQRDYNLLIGIFIVSSLVVIVFNFIADVLYSVADPRVQLGGDAR